MCRLFVIYPLFVAAFVLFTQTAQANDGGGYYWWDEVSEPDVVQEDSPDPDQPGPDPNQPGPDTLLGEDAPETVAPAPSSNDGSAGCVLGAATANGVSALVFLLALITGGVLSLRSRRRERE